MPYMYNATLIGALISSIRNAVSFVYLVRLAMESSCFSIKPKLLTAPASGTLVAGLATSCALYAAWMEPTLAA